MAVGTEGTDTSVGPLEVANYDLKRELETGDESGYVSLAV